MTKYNRDLALKLARLTKKVYSPKECESSYYKSVVKKVDGINIDLQFCILKDKENITIVFKGSAELNDWITNFSIKEKNILHTNITAHVGFVSSLELFLDTVLSGEDEIDGLKIKDIFKEFIENKSNYKFIITGHSLGGAIATLFSTYLESRKINHESYVAYTFGAPPVGWNIFYDTFKDVNLFRIINQYDPVPKVDKVQKLKHVGKVKKLISDEYEHHSANHYINNLEKEEKITLKRGKPMNIINMMLRYKWISFLVILVINSIVLGIWGYKNSGYTTLDAVYLSFDLLTLDFTIKKDLNWQLEIARFSALLFVSSAIIKAVLHFLDTSLVKPFRLSRYENHIVIFGFNGHVRELVKNIKDTKIIIVSSEEINTHDLDIQAQTIATPKHLSVKFMKTLALEHAKKIICMDMKDDIDITNANGIIEFLNDRDNAQNIKLYIHLHSSTLQDLFNHEHYISLFGKMPCDIKVFNHYENAVKILFREVAMESYLKSSTTHWLITGEWNQKIAFMRYVAQISYYEDEELPTITLVCNDVKSSIQEIREQFPKLEKTIKLNVVDSFSNHAEQKVTHVAVLYENYAKGLEESLMINNILKETPIFLLQREESIITSDNIIPFGKYETLNTQEIIFDEELDTYAKNINTYYQNLYGGQDWDELSLFKKNSNRMQAEHIDIKLRGIGWNDKNDFTDYVKFIEENKELKEKWARVEHMRWNAFHYVNGWDYSEKRDDSRKLHNCLVPFDELSKEEQEKDEPALLEISKFKNIIR